MANTFSSLYYHLIFSTKNRKYFIKPDIEERVWSYLGGISRDLGANPLSIGGIDDHIHALLMAKPKHSPSGLMQTVKGKSSKWMSSELPGMNQFGWQDGYGVFSVSKSNVPNVIEYIENQRSRHTGISFEDEFRRMLTLHDLDDVDPRYIFGQNIPDAAMRLERVYLHDRGLKRHDGEAVAVAAYAAQIQVFCNK